MDHVSSRNASDDSAAATETRRPSASLALSLHGEFRRISGSGGHAKNTTRMTQTGRSIDRGHSTSFRIRE